ncbi:MAG: hypothetical protein ACOYIP_02095 [Coriobacteriales bacterium]
MDADRATALISALQQASAPSEEGKLSNLCYFGGTLDLGKIDQIAFPGTTAAGSTDGTSAESSTPALSAFGFFRVLIGLLIITALIVSAVFATQKVRMRGR